MQNIIDFFRKYNAVFWFIFLQLICVTLIFNYQPYHQSAFLNTSGRVSGAALDYADAFWNYFSLQQINDSLLEENARLYELVFNAQNEGQTAPVFQFQDTTQFNYQLITAGVIRNSIHRQRNYFTIDKGSKHGVTREMGVISRNGVAGIVLDVSDHYAVCISLLHTESRVSGRLEQSNYTGQVVWKRRTTDGALIEDIPLHVKVSVGERIITSGYSAIFPKGIPIAEVTDVRKIEGSNFWQIESRLNTAFQRLDYVYVISKKDIEEIIILEEAYYAE